MSYFYRRLPSNCFAFYRVVLLHMLSWICFS
uniref:Uncharacterized protein n=1 Tax=Siphoviridae sp. ctGDt6 TaxID=2825408 RepID=A0A8S5U817_9CAUD|nr:MAG TPA: hypothetical protein [Siphoviridae sp. ctGDt6]